MEYYILPIIIVSLLLIFLMKAAYNSLKPKTGVHIAGIYQLKVVPREWLASEYDVDFATGKLKTAIELIDGKEWLTLSLIADSYLFQENPKSSKGGTFYDKIISGTTNEIDAEILQVLETLRYHEFVVIAIDVQKRKRITGNLEAGMLLEISNLQKNNNGEILSAALEFKMEEENASPFYETMSDLYKNWIDAKWEVATIIADPGGTTYYPEIIFEGASPYGETEIEAFNLPSPPAAHFQKTIGVGVNYYFEGLIEWIGFDAFTINKVRWRKKFSDGSYSEWKEKELIAVL